MKKYKPLFKQIAFFGFVGGVSLLIDVSVTYICFHILGLPAYLASAVGFLSAFGFNFPVNRKKVFNHSHLDTFKLRTQMVLYALLCVFNLIVTSALVELIVYVGIEISFAKILVTALIAVWNFLIFKFLIFSKKAEA